MVLQHFRRRRPVESTLVEVPLAATSEFMRYILACATVVEVLRMLPLNQVHRALFLSWPEALAALQLQI
jgi:hypothetical protein